MDAADPIAKDSMARHQTQYRNVDRIGGAIHGIPHHAAQIAKAGTIEGLRMHSLRIEP
jgi:hypothetical protein